MKRPDMTATNEKFDNARNFVKEWLDYQRVPTWAMYDQSGNDAVTDAMTRLLLGVEGGSIVRNTLPTFIKSEMAHVVTQGHSEVNDTEPEWAIVDFVNEVLCEPNGWTYIDRDALF